MSQLLVINPNTSYDITEKVARAVAALAPAGVEIVAVSGAFGPRYIASRAAFAIASHGALDCFARSDARADCVLLACFGDPGLDALREVAAVPVIGLIEAAVAEAARHGARYSIVTGGALWRDMLGEALQARGLAAGLASILTVAPTGAQIAADPEGAFALLAQACARAIREDGAQSVILGGAGLVGLARRLEEQAGAPVVCSIEAGARAAFAALAAHGGAGRFAASQSGAAPVDSVGLSPALAALLAQRPPAR